MELKVTTFTAAVLGLVYLVLSLRVSQIRMGSKVSLGDGGDPVLNARIRAHANFGEYVPIVLILMALVESAVGYSVLLGVVAATVIVARIAHAWGMPRPAPNPGRLVGTAGTWGALLVLSVWALVIAIRLI